MNFADKFWRAPELLNYSGPANVKGDVYSFGIILQEIITRNEPYGDINMEPMGKRRQNLQTFN